MMRHSELAYLVDETVTQLRTHLREASSCTTMVEVLTGVMPSRSAASKPANLQSADPLDNLILSLCGDKNSMHQPTLHEVLDKEIGQYRQRVARSKQELKQIIYGATPERRLQRIVHETVAATRGEQTSRQRPLLPRLTHLVAAIDDLGARFPDLVGRNFDLSEARQLTQKTSTDIMPTRPTPPPTCSSRPTCLPAR
jgi:hypothetical protein